MLLILRICKGILHSVLLFIKYEGFFFDPDSIVQQQETQQINDPETSIISSAESRQYSIMELRLL